MSHSPQASKPPQTTNPDSAHQDHPAPPGGSLEAPAPCLPSGSCSRAASGERVRRAPSRSGGLQASAERLRIHPERPNHRKTPTPIPPIKDHPAPPGGSLEAPATCLPSGSCFRSVSGESLGRVPSRSGGLQASAERFRIHPERPNHRKTPTPIPHTKDHPAPACGSLEAPAPIEQHVCVDRQHTTLSFPSHRPPAT